MISSLAALLKASWLAKRNAMYKPSSLICWNRGNQYTMNSVRMAGVRQRPSRMRSKRGMKCSKDSTQAFTGVRDGAVGLKTSSQLLVARIFAIEARRGVELMPASASQKR